MNRTYAPWLLILLCVAQCIFAASPTTGVRETVGPMTIVRPTEWARKQMPEGRLIFTPAMDGDTRAEVDISSTNISGVDVGTYHLAGWEELGGRSAMAQQRKSGRFARFEWSEMTTKYPSDKKRSWCRLYTTKVDNAAVSILVASDSVRAFRKLVAQLEEILSQAQFE